MSLIPIAAYLETQAIYELAPPLGTGHSQSQRLDAALSTESVDWFSFHQIWGVLGVEVLGAIAQSLQRFKIGPGTAIYHEGQTPVGLYFLKWGTVEIYRHSSIGQTHILYRSAGELFGYVPLVESTDSATYGESAIALTATELWFLPRDDFDRLLRTYPTLQSPINRLLIQDLSQIAQRVSQEEVRIQGLQQYIHAVPAQEPLIGTSKTAQKLAQQIETAAADLKPVIFQAPGGSGKTFLAGLIHARSGLAARPFAEIDCAHFPVDEAGVVQSDALFGVAAGAPGVLELLERGTLLIDNAQRLTGSDRDRLCHYLQSGTLTRNPGPMGQAASPMVDVWVRLIFASPKPLEFPELDAHTIKLCSLFQRKGDIPDFARYFLERFCREQGRSPVSLDQADLRRLISYPYPGNLSELAGILQRAVLMTPLGQSVVPESVLWSVQSEKNAFRVDLLNQFPWMRQFFLSRWWPERFWVLVMAIFIPVTVMGYLGPQTRDASMTLNFFWAWWWPFYLFLFAFVGRIWCAICPFMITGEWLRQLSLWIWPRDLLPWPNRWMNRWGAWLLFAGFVAIYLWEKLWDLPHHPYLSSWLLLAITLGAVVFSLIYERRLWCRHLCPIGGMNGMFAKLSMLELRSTQQVCGSQCNTFGCYKGGEAAPVLFTDALPNEGQATQGCPLYSHPAQLPDNRDCMLCMDCLKACPNRSVQLNLRFPATDLLEEQQSFWAEAALLLLLLGGVLMHHSEDILTALGWGNLPVDSDHLLTGLPVVVVLLSIPAVLIGAVHLTARLFDPDLPDSLAVVYAYLPLTLAANLADYLPVAMVEAGQILPVIARTFGYSGLGLPTLTWSLDVAQFLQGVTLLSALVFSIYPLLRITQRPFLSNLPHLLLIVSFTVFFFYLLIPPI